MREPKPEKLIIGLSGWAQSGKDSVAAILQQKFLFAKCAFADLLRQSILALNPIVSVEFNGRVWRVKDCLDAYGYEGTKKNFPEYRYLLQAMGTEVGRTLFHYDFWVDKTIEKIHESPFEKWVIADVRFPNEAEAIQRENGKVIRIDRPGVTAVNDHISEHALDDFDFDLRINNAGSLADLEKEVIFLFG
jgi:hypothetical protein